ncbi:MAG: tRNA (N(6)-L-threonylcarbamoyladenosine(37)-C(2))-methylthiotransferase MtaB [Ignavibacteria bacterium RBG_16_34_14]|nr:MAG: tRNA (N(6)-L-threonylcarbamoyladenosine(37)-C(2))-methylthiotransferase MtaB [Ignavibacteria bacterium RBG_16_34_14]
MIQRVALHTLGCKLNFSETSTIGNEFLKNGFGIVDFKEKADVYVLNTCTVTQNAEKECRQLVRKVLKQNPEAYIIVTGCYAQLRPEEIANIKGVDVILGSNEKFNLFSLINNFQKRNPACIFVSPTDKLNDFGPAHSTDADNRTRAYLKIQDGCDYKCSFCTIPLARGLSRSMNPDEVIYQFKNLIDEGYREIILTGVNVGDYGKSYSTNLYKLLLKLVGIEGDYRIRISSIEPNLLTDEIIQLTSENEKMCKHFHIPLQSGSSKILKLMKRRYKTDDYSELIYKCKNKIPDLGIGVDVIVGFPGETEEDFLQTYNFLNELPVSYLHVFTYSERPDTKAIEIENPVDIYERRKRNNMLRILSEKKRYKFYKEMIGKDLDVLFETENFNDKIKGFSSNYVRVSLDYNPNLVNQVVTISIDDIIDNCCSGTIKGTKNSIELIAS